MILLARLWGIIAGSFWGRIMGGATLAFGALLANNAYQRSKGAKQERVRIIEKTEKVGKDRNAKSEKIRKKIRTSKPGAAMRRLRLEFSGAD